MYQTPLTEIAKDRTITGNTLRTWLGLLSVMDFDNEAVISQKALADLIDMQQAEVSRALRILENKGIITRSKNKYGLPVHKINQAYVLKGDIKPVRLVRKHEARSPIEAT